MQYVYFIKSFRLTATAKQKLLSLLWCFLWAFVYAIRSLWIPELLIRPILCAVFMLFVWRVYSIALDAAISAYLLAYGISYTLLVTVSLAVAFVFAPLRAGYDPGARINYDTPVSLLMIVFTVALQFLLSYLLFRIKRFRHGFPFLAKRDLAG